MPYFKINAPIFCCPLFSENYLNPQVKINKMVSKHTVYYHPNPSQLTSRIHSLIFLCTPKRYISPEFFLEFFLNLYIPPWLRKSFKFMVLRLLADTFLSEKIESVDLLRGYLSQVLINSTIVATLTFSKSYNMVMKLSKMLLQFYFLSFVLT